MIHEKVIYLDLIGQERKMAGKLHVHFNDKCHATLLAEGVDISKTESNYVECLVELLKAISPEYKQLMLINQIFIKTGKQKLELLEITETVSLKLDVSAEEDVLHFALNCSYGGKEYAAEASEDFSIALQQLKENLPVEFQICGFCVFSDFKSDGSEDLRHGWYCFRENEEIDLDIPWFQREDSFNEAIPFINAFYWCPHFQYSAKAY